jgi:hypothetical protein
MIVLTLTRHSGPNDTIIFLTMISLMLMSMTEVGEEDWKEGRRMISVLKQSEIVIYTPRRRRQ